MPNDWVEHYEPPIRVDLTGGLQAGPIQVFEHVTKDFRRKQLKLKESFEEKKRKGGRKKKRKDSLGVQWLLC